MSCWNQKSTCLYVIYSIGICWFTCALFVRAGGSFSTNPTSPWKPAAISVWTQKAAEPWHQVICSVHRADTHQPVTAQSTKASYRWCVWHTHTHTSTDRSRVQGCEAGQQTLILRHTNDSVTNCTGCSGLLFVARQNSAGEQLLVLQWDVTAIEWFCWEMWGNIERVFSVYWWLLNVTVHFSSINLKSIM